VAHLTDCVSRLFSRRSGTTVAERDRLCAFAAFAGGGPFRLGRVLGAQPFAFVALSSSAGVADGALVGGEADAADGAELRRMDVAVAVAGDVLGCGGLDERHRDLVDDCVVMCA
jgi:hypothetical protein